MVKRRRLSEWWSSVRKKLPSRRAVVGGISLIGLTGSLYLSRPEGGTMAYLRSPPQLVLRQIAKTNGFPKESILAFMRMPGALGRYNIERLKKTEFRKWAGEKEFAQYMHSTRGLAIGFWYLLEDSRAKLENAKHITYRAPIRDQMGTGTFDELSNEARSRVIVYEVLKGGLPILGGGITPLASITPRNPGVVDYRAVYNNASVQAFLDAVRSASRLSVDAQSKEIQKLDFDYP